MKVDFNQLRLKIQTSHNDLVELLNEHFDPEHERIMLSPNYAYEMRGILLEMRQNIIILMCMFSDEPVLIDDISGQARLLHTEFLE